MDDVPPLRRMSRSTFFIAFVALAALSTANGLSCYTGMSTTGTGAWATGGSTITCAAGVTSCSMSYTVGAAYMIACSSANQPTTTRYTTGCSVTVSGVTQKMKVSTSDFGTKTPAQVKAEMDAISASCLGGASDAGRTTPSIILASMLSLGLLQASWAYFALCLFSSLPAPIQALIFSRFPL